MRNAKLPSLEVWKFGVFSLKKPLKLQLFEDFEAFVSTSIYNILTSKKNLGESNFKTIAKYL
jgi:hypothetical protein